MDLKRIQEITQQEMEIRKEPERREPGWLFYHGLRTSKIAEELCDMLNADIDRGIVFAGALFHDIGKGSNPHNIKGAELTNQLLTSHCGAHELHEVCEIVKLHNQRHESEKHSLWVRIVQDADLLDHVGPVTVWSTFYFSGLHKENMQDHINFVTGEESGRFRKSMRGRLNFDVSVKMFDERVQWEDDLFATVRKTYSEGVWHNKAI